MLDSFVKDLGWFAYVWGGRNFFQGVGQQKRFCGEVQLMLNCEEHGLFEDETGRDCPICDCEMEELDAE